MGQSDDVITMTTQDRIWIRVQEGEIDLQQAIDLLAEYYEAKGDFAREDSVIERQNENTNIT
jgi:hypothetical protein